MAVLPPLPQPQMTPRARAYLLICAIRHIVLGMALVMVPEAFQSETYRGVKNLLPLPPDNVMIGWGGVFLSAGLLSLVAAWIGREGEARWALLVSVLTTALWAGAFLVYVGSTWITTGDLVNPSGPVVWSAICLKDITMLRSPLRNPFEELVRRAASEADADGA